MYREYLPPPALAPYVDRLWTKVVSDVSATSTAQRVLPDGCVDILFYLGPSPRGRVVGTMTRAFLVEPVERQHIVAVRFRPGAAFAFLATPAHVLTDLHVELEQIWPEVGPLHAQLASTLDVTLGLRILERELLRRRPLAGSLDPMVHAGVILLRRAQPTRIADLASELGVTRQHLTRQFKVHVGIGPKEFERVMRMSKLSLLLSGAGEPPKARSAAQLACELGYYDQSHMIHEFKSLAGLTPSEYAKSTRDSIFPIQGPFAAPHSSA